MLRKKEVREAMRAARRAISPKARAMMSEDICRRILLRGDVAAVTAAKGVFAVYLAVRDEVDLSYLVKRLWDMECPVAVPAWRGDSYSLVRLVRGGGLAPGPKGILEPLPSAAAVDPAEPAVWIVPGLAFTPDGRRIGYGGGWYDRLLARARPGAVVLGVAYPCQVAEDLPVEPHDAVLTGVVVACSGEGMS